jgi:hypothetical protein
MDDDRRVVKIADQLAVQALATDGATLEPDVIRAGMAQLGDIFGESLVMSGATEAHMSFGVDVDADLGALVVTRAGEGLLEVTLQWDVDDFVFLWDEDPELIESLMDDGDDDDEDEFEDFEEFGDPDEDDDEDDDEDEDFDFEDVDD